MRYTALLTLALTASAASGAAAQTGIGDAAQGRAYVEKNCAECHFIEKGAKTPALKRAPAFQEVANSPRVTELSLRVFFRSPHPNMPNLVLSREEADNVIAYIMSLR